MPTTNNAMRKSVEATSEFGLIIRRAALPARGVAYEQVLHALEGDPPLDADDDLISFGPLFGRESLDEFIRRLTALGLEYYDDFSPLVFDLPRWMHLRVGLIENAG